MDGAAALPHDGAMETWQFVTVVVVFVLAGGVKGVTGMGLPTVAMSLLVLWMTPLQAAAMLILPSLATNVAQCRGPHARRLAARLWPGWTAIAVVTVTAPGFGTQASTASARAWLGAILIAYGVWGLRRRALPDLSGRGAWLGAIAGAATGVVTAMTAVFVLPWVAYLQTLRLGKDELVQALGLSFTIATLALAVRVQIAVPSWWWAASGVLAAGLSLGAALVGLRFGEALRARLAGPEFQKALFIVFIALGLANLARAG